VYLDKSSPSTELCEQVPNIQP